MNKLYMLGSGGHARAVSKNINCQVLYYDDSLEKGQHIGDFFQNFQKDGMIFVGIGNNEIRKKIMEECITKFGKKYIANIISSKALIQEGAVIEENAGVFIAPNAFVSGSAIIEKGVIINTAAIIEHDCIIEKYGQISPNATICGTVRIEENCFIGANATIIQNLTIQKDTIIGAGSVAIKNLDTGKYAGNPIRKLEEK